MIRATLCGVLVATALGCTQRPSPTIAISAVVVFAPLPGSAMSAAYFEIDNSTAQEVVINQFESPQFARIELHETRISEGVARMRELPSLVVPAHSTVTLTEGGKHLMLMQPRVDLRPGQAVTITLRDATGEMYTLDAELQSR